MPSDREAPPECPECGEILQYDEVDIGVGVLRGNTSCPGCGWCPDDVIASILGWADEPVDGEDFF
jgi:ribosomal protein S27AE